MNNIIQWNCRGLPTLLIFDYDVTNKNQILCCLQETMLTKDDFIIRGFNCINLTSRDIGGRKQSPYPPRLKPLLFVHYICLQVKILILFCYNNNINLYSLNNHT